MCVCVCVSARARAKGSWEQEKRVFAQFLEMQESVYLESTGLGATPMQTLPFFVMVAYLQQPRHAEQVRAQ